MRTLGVVLTARIKKERIATYNSELVYLLVKTKYKNVTSPSEYAESLLKPPAKPKPKKSIIKDIISKLG